MNDISRREGTRGMQSDNGLRRQRAGQRRGRQKAPNPHRLSSPLELGKGWRDREPCDRRRLIDVVLILLFPLILCIHAFTLESADVKGMKLCRRGPATVQREFWLEVHIRIRQLPRANQRSELSQPSLAANSATEK